MGRRRVLGKKRGIGAWEEKRASRAFWWLKNSGVNSGVILS
jgi:hypothetical protein